jgi:hypothetical protein
MNSTRPEAGIEYSRAKDPSNTASGGNGGGSAGPKRALRIALLVGGLAGAALLLAAEFTPLLEVHSSAGPHVVKTVGTGSHHSYALAPVALLAGALAYGVWLTGNRLALVATGLLGLLALLIALIGDLPDAQASGLIGSPATHFYTATSTPSTGLYLETLGAILLLISAGGGLLLIEPPPRVGRDVGSGTTASRTRSAS